MSILKPGTLCVTVGGTGENSGRIVEVICYVGQHRQEPSITEGYRIITVSGRPFTAVTKWRDGTRTSARHAFCETIADRRNLRPLDDPKVEAEEHSAATSTAQL